MIMKKLLIIGQSQEAESALRNRSYTTIACETMAEAVSRAKQFAFDFVVYLPASAESLYTRGIDDLYKISDTQPGAKIFIGNPVSARQTDDFYETLEPDLQKLNASLFTRGELMGLIKSDGLEFA